MKRNIAVSLIVLALISTTFVTFSGNVPAQVQHVLEGNNTTAAMNEVTPSQVAWEWIVQTGDTEQVFLKVYIGVLYWADNTTKIPENTQINAYMNGTLNDFGFVNAYGRISNADGHLYLGAFNTTWNYVNASIWAMNLNSSGYDDLVWEEVIEVQHVLNIDTTSSFVDVGAEAFIRNDIGYSNKIEVVIYTDSTADYVHAPVGVEVLLRLRSMPTATNYSATRITDSKGFVYWTISDSFADTLCSGVDPYAELYYTTNVTNGYTLVQRFPCITLASPTVTTTATTTGVYIDIVPDFTINTSLYTTAVEYSNVQGQPDTYMFSVNVNTSASSWQYSTVSNIYRVFLPDSLTDTTDYNLTVVQTLQANLILAQSFITFTIDAPLFITERMVMVGYNQVSISGKASAECTYTVTESGSSKGSGTVSGNFVVYWNRAAGTGDQFFLVNFTRGTSFVAVNGTYSKAQSSVLTVEEWSLGFDDAYINIYCTSNFGNTTLYIYDNDVYRATSPEADVVQYRKQTDTGVHEVGVKVDAGSSFVWKNFTYSIAVIIEALKMAVFSFDSGSPDTVSGQFQTNWSNCTVTITEGTTTKWSGAEGDSGVSFYFMKTQSEGTHIITVTFTSGSSSLSYDLGYSYRPQPSGGSVLPPNWDETLQNATQNAIRSSFAASGTVIMSPAVFAGIVGLVVILIVIVIGQVAFRIFGKSEERKQKDLAGKVPYIGW